MRFAGGERSVESDGDNRVVRVGIGRECWVLDHNTVTDSSGTPRGQIGVSSSGYYYN